MINAVRGREFGAGKIDGRIADSATLSPLFVPLGAGQGTGSR